MRASTRRFLASRLDSQACGFWYSTEGKTKTQCPGRNMPKISDRERVLRLLQESEGLSSRQIKTELNLSDDRYDSVRKKLLGDGLVKKYVCRGGGIRLTPKGDGAAPTQQDAQSTVNSEGDLYPPLIDLLETEAKQDDAGLSTLTTSPTVCMNVMRLRRIRPRTTMSKRGSSTFDRAPKALKEYNARMKAVQERLLRGPND
jgi:hypothetical protein